MYAFWNFKEPVKMFSFISATSHPLECTLLFIIKITWPKLKQQRKKSSKVTFDGEELELFHRLQIPSWGPGCQLWSSNCTYKNTFFLSFLSSPMQRYQRLHGSLKVFFLFCHCLDLCRCFRVSAALWFYITFLKVCCLLNGMLAFTSFVRWGHLSVFQLGQPFTVCRSE